VLGAIVARGWVRGIVIAAVVVFAIQVYLTASWFDWQFGASFGHRAFTDGLGLAALLVAACFEWAARRAPVRRLVTTAAVMLVALSIVQMVQYWTHNIPEASTTWDQYRESFLRFR
jgi:di/tricarboxylate transporter